MDRDRRTGRPPDLSESELAVLKTLWDLGAGTVREVNAELSRRGRRWAYTTVQTIFARLEEKKAVRRTRKIGNAFLFEPLITRRSVYRRMIDEFLDLFGGSAEPVVSHLLETGKLTLEDLKALEERRTEEQE